MAQRDYLTCAHSLGIVGSSEAIVLELYSERLQKFRLAALGHGTVQPPDSERARVAKYFDPLPFWSDPTRVGDAAKTPDPAQSGTSMGGRPTPDTQEQFPLSALTQRPMFMYHAWGSQNAWLRQIAARNFLYLHPDTARVHGINDGDDVFAESAHGRIRAQAKFHAGTAPGVVWTWNAIGKQRGAWKLDANAPEYTKGFLLNHVIDDLLPPRGDGYRYANADAVTGQAAWFDLKVRIVRAAATEQAA